MGWRVWGDSFSTASMTDKSSYQKVTFDKNYIIKAIRSWFVVYNDPAFTSIHARIYSDEAGLPRKLLATSTNVITKAQMITATNGAKEVYFDFNNFSVRQDNAYHVVINGVGYTGSDSSHLAWMKAFPDPILVTTPTLTANSIAVAPYQIYFIGSEF